MSQMLSDVEYMTKSRRQDLPSDKDCVVPLKCSNTNGVDRVCGMPGSGLMRILTKLGLLTYKDRQEQLDGVVFVLVVTEPARNHKVPESPSMLFTVL